MVPGGFTGKMLELLKEAVPTASRIAVLWSSKNPLHVAFIPKELPPAAEVLGVWAQALLVLGDPMFHRPFGRVPELALRAKLPSLYLESCAASSISRIIEAAMTTPGRGSASATGPGERDHPARPDVSKCCSLAWRAAVYR